MEEYGWIKITDIKPHPENPRNHDDKQIKKTVAPNRNMILLSLAVGYAVSIKADNVAYAAHSGDHHIYPDCRPIFFEKMNSVCNVANYQPINIIAPFLYLTKRRNSKTWT